jgi:hypothetical protein
MAKSKKNKLPIKLDYPTLKELDFSNQKMVSFSQYSLYKSCAHKWYNQYVKKIKPPPSIDMTFGTAMHNTMQSYLNVMYNQSGTAANKIDIEEHFGEQLKSTYKEEMTKFGSHFSNKEQLNEYYEDGIAILQWFKSHRGAYFSLKNTFLVGIEMPIQKEVKNNVIFQGYIDLVMYNTNTNKIYIYDFKTSKKGWNDWNKKDDTKLSQLLLYKQYFSELYNFPIENIDVEFIILKRKIQPNEFIEFPKRLQTFTPANGKIKLKQSQESFIAFLNDVFDDNGKFIEKEYPKNVTKLCDWCHLKLNNICNGSLD